MKNKIFWGLFFIVGGILIVINQLGYLPSISLLNLVLLIFLIPIMIKSIININFSGIFFPLAVIGILFAEPLGITALTPWPILIVALLLSLGLSLIFGPSRRMKGIMNHHHKGHATNIENGEDDSEFESAVSFGETIKYVNSDDFKKAKLTASFGALSVYFDNAKLSKDGAEIYIDASFAGVELFIPKEWNVKCGITAFIGGVDEKYNRQTKEGPEVKIKGTVSFAGVEIHYI